MIWIIIIALVFIIIALTVIYNIKHAQDVDPEDRDFK